MEITVTKINTEGDYQYCADDLSRPGSPKVGYGKNQMEAIGDFFFQNQSDLDITFDIKVPAHDA